MLQTLEVQNFAIVEKLEINFTSGLNIITGETGAGKSILLGAIGLLLGGRGAKDYVRKGASKAIISGLWKIAKHSKAAAILRDNQIEWDDGIVQIVREINSNGLSRIAVNEQLVSVQVLSAIGTWLVDLHGQHQHQMLLDATKHIYFYDDAVTDHTALADFNHFRSETESLRDRFSRRRAVYEENKRNMRLMQFEYNELSTAGISIEEWHALSADIKRLENIERIIEEMTALQQLIENGLSAPIGEMRNHLDKVSQWDDKFNDWYKESESTQTFVNELLSFVDSYRSDIDFSPAEIDQKRERYQFLHQLSKKYQRSVEELIDYQAEIASKIEDYGDDEDQLRKLETAYEDSRRQLGEKALHLSELRRAKKTEIQSKMHDVLAKMGMSGAQFDVKMSMEEATGGLAVVADKSYKTFDNGIDKLEFFLSSNPGEDFKPLVKIASGGEISRIMLALKTILAEADEIPTMLFDEIDTGISGKVANAVGLLLANLSVAHQTICITHLPQIAAYAESHFQVYKETRNERTFTNIRRLSETEKAEEIATLIGGQINKDTMAAAKSLIEKVGT
jgi:DNA repair protein RecN (Recombination protein N)